MNALWRSNQGKVHRSDRYSQWRHDAGWEKAQRPGHVDGQCKVVIGAGKPDERCRDINGIPKALLDLLQACSVLNDDSQVTSLMAKWDNTVAPGCMIIVKGTTDA